MTARASREPARARRRNRRDDHPKRRDARGGGTGGPGRRATASLRFRAVDQANRALRPSDPEVSVRDNVGIPYDLGRGRAGPGVAAAGNYGSCSARSARRCAGADGRGGSARELPDTDRRPPVRTVRFHNIGIGLDWLVFHVGGAGGRAPLEKALRPIDGGIGIEQTLSTRELILGSRRSGSGGA